MISAKQRSKRSCYIVYSITMLLFLDACDNATVSGSALANAPMTGTTSAVAIAASTPPIETAHGICAARTSIDTGASTPQTATKKIEVRYDSKENAIVIGKGVDATLVDVGRSLNDSSKLRERVPGEWVLSANLHIEKGGALHIGGAGVQRLKLKSDPTGFVWIKALGGTLTFENVCVTSWDMQNDRVDENYEDGRSFVLARDGADMRIHRAELSYLGYDANESYGLAWRLQGTTGDIVDSVLGYNFYGLYTYEISGLTIRGNEVHHSIRYGIDPHTTSKQLLIENNVSHHNGKHGIILAEDCTESTIRNNTVYSNSMHGIVLYQRSNNNTVETNTVYGNGYEGIDLNESANNTVTNNTVYQNAKAGIGIGQESKNNTISGNSVHDNNEDGIALYSDAENNVITQNEVRDNQGYGVSVKSNNNQIGQDNRVLGNRKGDVRE